MKTKLTFLLLLSITLLALTGCSLFHAAPENSSSAGPSATDATPAGTDSSANHDASVLSVHFIDVGKADSILIINGDSAMLVDAGTSDMADKIIDYIKAQGVSKLDLVIGTHSDTDHIGGMKDVLKTFKVGKFIMPTVDDDSNDYQNVIMTAKDIGLTITEPEAKSRDTFGQCDLAYFAPNSASYSDKNNYSVVFRLAFGDTSFLFTGDALKESELEMLNRGYPLASTVLKVAHHGSNEASSIEFLKAVKPEYAVLCTDGNVDGYASKKTLQRLASVGAAVYRTDEAGTIIATSDGKTVTFNCEPSPPEKPKSNKN